MISLPVLDNAKIQRPIFAQGPRSLSSVRLLRLSVTDRCNLRCIYCMPDDGVSWMANQRDFLSADDIVSVVKAAQSVGIDHYKITGGEPTVRKDCVEVVERIAGLGVGDLSLTTNALFLDRLAAPLREAGLDRITVSCDSLVPEKYAQITHGGDLGQFWRGVDAAMEAGFHRLKINVVVMNGVNDDEVADFARLADDHNWTVRFIEYMPLGDAQLMHTGRDPEDAIISNDLIRKRIEQEVGPLEPIERRSEVGVGPADVFTFAGAEGRLGFISAMSKPFCESCNRLRLTAIGELRSCLFDGGEVSLLPALRPTVNHDHLIRLFHQCVILKPETHSPRGNRAMSQLGG